MIEFPKTTSTNSTDKAGALLLRAGTLLGGEAQTVSRQPPSSLANATSQKMPASKMGTRHRVHVLDGR